MDPLQHTQPFASPLTRLEAGRGSSSRHPHQRRGFTLVEAAVTLAILAVLACGAAPSFQGLIERQRLAGLAAQLATDVQFVRHESILRDQTLRLSFYSAAWGSCYVVHTGSRQQCSCAAASRTATCVADAVQLKTVIVPASTGVTVQANVSSILFDPLHGTSTPTGTLRVRSESAGSIHHIVNLLGRVRTCSPRLPGPVVSGYRVC